MRIRLLSAVLAIATACVLIAVPAPASASVAPNALRAGSALPTGAYLRSTNGAYTAQVTAWGRLVLRHGSRIVWASPSRGPSARLVLRPYGNLVLISGSHILWQTNTAMSRATALVLSDSGFLQLVSSGGVAWGYRIGNACGAGAQLGKRVIVTLSRQFARLCDHAQQMLATSITSGASAYGDGTPTGLWRLQSKQRDRYLYPASGGAYYVHFWMPYDGAYGMHDSPWQHFPYGSPKYRTAGSHGCVHFPYAAIAWMYAWAPIGTLVHIQN